MSDLQIADHLFVDCGAYSHHGIYIGEGRVVNFDSTAARKVLGTVNGAPPKIVEVSMDEFSGGSEIHVRAYEESSLCFDSTEAVARAKSKLGERGYDLALNNCEHFAVWCKTGESSSTQVDSACKVVSAGAAADAMGTATIRSAKLLPAPYKIAAYTAGAVVAVGSTTYQYVVERKKNRNAKTS